MTTYTQKVNPLATLGNVTVLHVPLEHWTDLLKHSLSENALIDDYVLQSSVTQHGQIYSYQISGGSLPRQ